jgi:serine/threonine protein kinase
LNDHATKDDRNPPTAAHDAAGLPSSAPTPSPTRLGVYEVQSRLGQGGMGTVWKAWHTRLKRTVALKTLRADCLHDAPAVARFQREMEAVGKLDHPNLIRATDAGDAAGIHFLVMDFVEGLDASKLVQQHGPLPVADACEIIRQAALGLQHAHEAGLVHRDVKPSNLMVSNQGQVKVLDLGLALLHASPNEHGELTGSNQGMGTTDYMAPEQGASAHNVDIRADVYSLGCTLYKLLAGRAPFSGSEYSTPFKKMEAHAQTPVPPLCDRRPEVPADLVAVLERMLAKAPADRFDTPGAAAEALAPFAAGADLPWLLAESEAPAVDSPGVETGPFGPPTPASARESALPATLPQAKKRSRRRWWATAAVLAGAAVGAGLLAWWPRRPAEPDLTPGVWHNLLERSPERLLWSPTEVPPRFEKERQRLTVSCEGHGLLRLGGVPPRTAYRLQIGFRQPQWTGGVGLFFGYPEVPPAAEPFSFQQILLMPPTAPNGRYRLYRSLGTLSPSSPSPSRPTLQHLYSEEVGKLGSQEYILEIEVEKNGFLRAVRWDGKTMAILARPDDSGTSAPPAAHSIFGIAVIRSSAVLTTARLLISERD